MYQKIKNSFGLTEYYEPPAIWAGKLIKLKKSVKKSIAPTLSTDDSVTLQRSGYGRLAKPKQVLDLPLVALGEGM
jgi:hypothetical protein